MPTRSCNPFVLSLPKCARHFGWCIGFVWTGCSIFLSTTTCHSQTPRIDTLYPIGGRIGTTVDTELRGSGLAGTSTLWTSNPAVRCETVGAGSKPDESLRPVFQSKCGSCHELRSPANRSLTIGQWAATVDRMVKVRQAPLSSDEQAKVTRYLQGLAAAGRISAKLIVDSTAKPGLVEVRALTPRGASTAALFEVGNLPEITGANGKIDDAPSVTLPVVANGAFSLNAERHYYRFESEAGRRLVFKMKMMAYNELGQMFMNPQLRLFDSKGVELIENHGRFDLDPLIDWQCPQTGTYTLEARDLLGRGNPGNVYRLTMGELPYDVSLYPPVVQVGQRAQPLIISANQSPKDRVAIAPMKEAGWSRVSTPFGDAQVYVTSCKVLTHETANVPIEGSVAVTGLWNGSDRSHKYALKGEGTTVFEFNAARLAPGSETILTVRDARENVVATITGDGKTVANLKVDAAYSVTAEETGNKSGVNRVYYWESKPAVADIVCTVRPDNPVIPAGGSAYIELRFQRRDRINGVPKLVIEGLPDGVRVQSSMIAPDRDMAFVILTAATDARIDVTPITFRVQMGDDTNALFKAIPEETYNINNQPRYRPRGSMVLAVSAACPVTVETSVVDRLPIKPKQPTPIKVRITRKGTFAGPVSCRLLGLPNGWTAGQETIAAGKTEVTFIVRPDGGNQSGFLARAGDAVPWNAVLEITADDVASVGHVWKVVPEKE